MPTRTAAAVIGLVLTTILVTWSAADSSKERNLGAPGAGSKSATVNVPQVKDTELRPVLDTWTRRNRTPGAVVGVKVGDRDPVFAFTGVSDPHTRAALTDAAAFRIGGVTTAFVGAVALQLSEKDRLDLDATIDRWLPRFPHADRITVRDLLTHRSGIAPLGDDSDAPGPYAAATRAFVAAHPRHAFTSQEIVDFVQRRPLLSEPGTAVHYSNVNTILLGIVVSGVTNADLATALHTQLLDPLGLRDTYYAATERRPPAVPGVTLTPEAVTALGAAGAMVSTPRDLLEFSTGFFRTRARGSHDLSASVFRTGTGGTGLGVEGFSNDGFCMVAPHGCPPGAPFFAVGATGSVTGGSAAVVYDPVYDVSVVALASSDRVAVGDLALRALLLTKLGAAGYDKAVGFTAQPVPTTAGR
jgi:CubicO group peptidase (beta-lactamase class C family)